MNFRFVFPLAIVAVLVVVAVLISGNPSVKAQHGPPPTSNISVRDGTNSGEMLLSWDAVPQATHYRIGYVNMEVDYHFAKASCTGEWINAFVYVDENARNIPVNNGRAEYTIRRLDTGARHAFTVLTSNNFVDSGGSVNSEFFWPSNPRWTYAPGRSKLPPGITVPEAVCSTTADDPVTPTPTVQPSPTPTTPAPTPTATAQPPVPTSSCSGDDYDRSEWGSYPKVPSDATARWTLPSDDVNNSKLTHDHHVALKDAHISGGCDWSAGRKDTFSSDLDNLNPTTGSFNSSKGSRTPDQLTGIAERIINTNAEKCDYATQHKAVKDEYSLSMTTNERTTVNNWLALCE